MKRSTKLDLTLAVMLAPVTRSSGPQDSALEVPDRSKLLLSEEWDSDEPPLETDLHRELIRKGKGLIKRNKNWSNRDNPYEIWH